MALQDILHTVPAISPAVLILSLLILPILILTLTYAYTTFRYHRRLSSFTRPSDTAQGPPQIPYSVPYLGNSLSFLAPYPGQFWTRLFSTYRLRPTGACTLLLGGQPTHVLFDAGAVHALFKARSPTRDRFNAQVMQNSFGVARADIAKFYGAVEATGRPEDRVDPRWETSESQYEYMIRTDRVSELTEEFGTRFREVLKERAGEDSGEVLLSVWLRERMFKASTDAFLGTRLLEVYPELEKEFWAFDRAMLPLFFGLPKFIIPEEYKAREKALAGMERWHEAVWEESKGQPIEPDYVRWEPIYGSRLNRARQRFYMYRGISVRCKAGADLGVVFALSSNAIPASTWMLLHILNPKGDKTLLPRVLAELETARNDDGLNISTLISLPLLQSIFQEILRLYADVLVTRDINADLVLPLGDGKRKIQFRKGEMVMAPSWLAQRDEQRWINPPHDVFYAERFIKRDLDTGVDMFTMTGTGGSFFPFGGGKTICPGRVFAKQEVLAAVATVLLNYDIQPISFIDEQGNERDKFPGLAKRFGGNGVMTMDGDMKMKMKKRV